MIIVREVWTKEDKHWIADVRDRFSGVFDSLDTMRAAVKLTEQITGQNVCFRSDNDEQSGEFRIFTKKMNGGYWTAYEYRYVQTNRLYI